MSKRMKRKGFGVWAGVYGMLLLAGVFGFTGTAKGMQKGTNQNDIAWQPNMGGNSTTESRYGNDQSNTAYQPPMGGNSTTEGRTEDRNDNPSDSGNQSSVESSDTTEDRYRNDQSNTAYQPPVGGSSTTEDKTESDNSKDSLATGNQTAVGSGSAEEDTEENRNEDKEDDRLGSGSTSGKETKVKKDRATEDRTSEQAESESTPVTEQSDIVPEASHSSRVMIFVVIGIAVVLIALVVLIVVLLRKRQRRIEREAFEEAQARRAREARERAQEEELGRRKREQSPMLQMSGKQVTPQQAGIYHVRFTVMDGKGDKKELSYDLKMGESVIVGRSDMSEVVIEDAMLSRQHFMLSMEEKGMQITDLSTTNGTLVNGIAISRETALKSHDIVTAGGKQIQIEW